MKLVQLRCNPSLHCSIIYTVLANKPKTIELVADVCECVCEIVDSCVTCVKFLLKRLLL